MSTGRNVVDLDRFVTLRKAAETSGYEYSYLSRLVKSGKIASMPIDDRTKLVDLDSLKAYAEEHTPERFAVDQPQPT